MEASVFTAELYAILTAELYAILTAIKELQFDDNFRTVIYSDSRSAIEAIREYNPTPLIITQIKYELHILRLEGKITRICKNKRQ